MSDEPLDPAEDKLIDYVEMRHRIAKAIRDYGPLADTRVMIEPNAVPPPEMLPAVFVFLTGRETIREQQRISSGKRTDHRVTYSVWSVAWSMESLSDAVIVRDRLMALVEVALMRDRNLQGFLEKSLTLAGGLVQAGSDTKEPRFASAIETLVHCDVYTMVRN